MRQILVLRQFLKMNYIKNNLTINRMVFPEIFFSLSDTVYPADSEDEMK